MLLYNTFNSTFVTWYIQNAKEISCTSLLIAWMQKLPSRWVNVLEVESREQLVRRLPVCIERPVLGSVLFQAAGPKTVCALQTDVGQFLLL